MEKNVKVSILLEIYGELLTKTQYQFLDDYYNSDLSLSEIAEKKNITRQAVRTILVKSKKKLQEYEEHLQFMQKEKAIKELTQKLEKTNINKEQKQIIEQINNELDF